MTSEAQGNAPGGDPPPVPAGDPSPSGGASSGAGSRRRTILRHPLTAVALTALSGILVAVVGLFPKFGEGSESNPSVPTTTPGTGIAYRIDRVLHEEFWAVAFEGDLPSGEGLPDSGYSSAEAHRWALTRGAVEVGSSRLRLFLDNKGTARSTIRAVRVRVVERKPPIDDTVVTFTPQGANPVPEIAFDLGEGDLVTAVYDDQGVPRPYFRDHNVTVDPGETVELTLLVRARTCYCRYLVEIETVDALSTHTLTIGDAAGRPFEVSGGADDYRYGYEYGGRFCEPPMEGPTHRFLFHRNMNGGGVDCSRPVK